MFSRILIANRGEIAVRIMHTCREMGIETVAVYSEVDRAALHTRSADTASFIGGSPARESYLNGSAIVRAAQQSGADAIHPGYGFLAESAAFAEEVATAGLVWIGPPATAIRLLGDKVASKEAAVLAGVRVVPGYAAHDGTWNRLSQEAERIGYPVMLKAAAGGGGKGMRIVQEPAALAESYDAARREAAAAFGDDRVFMEKLLIRPRHVEMQILADGEGNVVYLGERDCSLQRRHQKVVEESPSPSVNGTLRSAMGEASASIIRASGYVNAGTVEFLLAEKEFYFLEVNTRIQVEHPVTEMTTGLDLVRLQIEIAAGRTLPFSQEDVTARGHAIEARIYAEDPWHNFLPATGTLDAFEPAQGIGIRNDAGVECGDAISMYYDPMIAKLIVHAETRSLAVARLQHALERYQCSGLTTNLEFLQWIAQEPSFVAGDVDIGFIDRTWRSATARVLPRQVLVAAALADTHAPPSADTPWTGTSGWRISGMARRLAYEHRNVSFGVTLHSQRTGAWRVTADDEATEVSLVEIRPHLVVYSEDDKVTSVSMTRIPGGYSFVHQGMSYQVQWPTPDDIRREAASVPGGDTALAAPMPGTIVRIPVEVGQQVERGDPLVIMEAMKMEHVVAAVSTGTIGAILVRPREMVAAGTLLITMTE